jgi:hypothetical protein
MSFGWDDVSEMRPPTGLYLIPQMRATMEWYSNEEKEQLETNLSQYCYVYHKSQKNFTTDIKVYWHLTEKLA